MAINNNNKNVTDKFGRTGIVEPTFAFNSTSEGVELTVNGGSPNGTSTALVLNDFWRKSTTVPVTANTLPNGTLDTSTFIQHVSDIFIGLQGKIRAGNGNGTTNRQFNTIFGENSLSANTSGFSSTAMGWGTLAAQTTGTQNSAYGAASLLAVTSGFGNSAFGVETGMRLTSGNSNTIAGWKSMFFATTASRNSSYGERSLYNLTIGVENNAFGAGALYEMTTQNFNTAFGQVALYHNAASNNTGVGWHAGGHNTTGSNNTYLGYESGGNTVSNVNTGSTGSNNTLLGANIAINRTILSGNTFVGANPTVPTNVTNSACLGESSVVDANNQIQLGNSSVNQVRTFGAVTFQKTYTDASVPNNSLYVDTTTGKLFFKNASGVANPLY
jgi:hypothetical protein